MASIIDKAIEMYKDELFSSIIYRELARLRGEEKLGRELSRLADMEEEHAEFWRDFLRKRGINVEGIRVSGAKLLAYKILVRLIGTGLALRLLETGESKAVEEYSRILDDPSLTPEEREALKRILEDELMHEHDLMEEEGRFKEFMEHVRDAVLGMSDGLVEILSVSAGLAGAYGDPLYVALGGAIVGVGGALSMGISAFTGARAQRQVRMSVLGRIRLASRHVASALVSRLRRILLEKGFSEPAVKALEGDLESNPELLSRLVAEEEHGLTEERLEDPAKAGLYTGLFYVVGAFVPLIPYFLLLPIPLAMPLSFLLAGAMLAMTGFVIAVSAGLNVKGKMVELVVAGIGAATATYLIGKLASIILGIEVS